MRYNGQQYSHFGVFYTSKQSMRHMLQLVWVSYVNALLCHSGGTEYSKGMMARHRTKQKSENITIQLQDWHPAPGGYMNGANDYDLAGVDAISTYAPLWIRTPGIWLASL